MPPDRWAGLTSKEAAARLATDGPNALAQDERRTPLRLVVDVLREPMFLLLLASATLYLVFGDVREALTLLGFVVVMITITVVQEGRTERALDALRDLASPRAQVLRDGEIVTVAGADIVRGDIVKVAEGDRVPADSLLREGTALSVDESLLTGESVPVSKLLDSEAGVLSPPGGDGTASIFSGTLIVAGRGLAEIVATGARSELGKIGAALRDVKQERTPLQREVDAVVRKMAFLGVGLSIVLVLVRGLLEHEWRAAVLSGITLAMALLPEEFPVVLTVFLALGAWRISKKHVLTRRVTAVETLGAVHVLCTDKTGTLTQNRMTIRRLRTEGAELELDAAETRDLPEDMHALIEYGILASPRDPFDPMEKAFHALGNTALHGTEHLHPRWEDAREYPLTADLLAVTHVWKVDDKDELVVATKGAPEAIFDLCHLSAEATLPWREHVEAMAKDGLRVLGVARSQGVVPQSPGHPHEVTYQLLGLVGLADPLRPSVAAAVEMCRRASVRVMMITGDHPDTARSIARAAGIDASHVVTGSEIEAMSDDALAAALASTSIVARAVPAHKLRIVMSLRASGLRVGMTGDGVNDAPALKAADIGIAMGERGTDVAREAAALVLVHDDFGSIVDAVRLGRRIYDNLRKAFGYVVAVHIPIAGLSLLPAMLGWGAILAPAHVVFLELVIDPACSVVFEMEPEEPDVMDRPPRETGAQLFDLRRLAWSVAYGLAALASIMGVLFASRAAGEPVGMQRTLAFVGLVTSNLTMLLASRSGTKPFWTSLRRWNAAVPLLAGMAMGLTLLIVAVPPLRTLFAFDACGPAQFLRTVALSALPVLAVDVLKVLRRGP